MSEKRRVAKKKLDTSLNGDGLVSSAKELDKVGVKIDNTTWIMVSQEKFLRLGAEGCYKDFQEKLQYARKTSLTF